MAAPVLRFALSVPIGWGIEPPSEPAHARQWLFEHIERNAAREGRAVDAARIAYSVRSIEHPGDEATHQWALYAEYEG